MLAPLLLQEILLVTVLFAVKIYVFPEFLFELLPILSILVCKEVDNFFHPKLIYKMYLFPYSLYQETFLYITISRTQSVKSLNWITCTFWHLSQGHVEEVKPKHLLLFIYPIIIISLTQPQLPLIDLAILLMGFL